MSYRRLQEPVVEALEPLEHDNRHRNDPDEPSPRQDGTYEFFTPFRHVPAGVNVRLKRLPGICVAC